VFPLPENDALLDKGFHEMGDGDYRHAMMDFQKVKDNQPALTGTDYLIAVSAFKAGESIIAEDAANQAISKNETADGARVIIALINLTKAKDSQAEDDQFADPRTTAETEIHHLAATHPENAGVYVLWGDLLRSNGTFRSAVDIFHKGVLRALPDDSRELLSAKEQLARLQNESAKTAPSLSALTSMSAEQALVAAFSCLQLHRSDDAAVFLQRARDLYAPGIFLELMADQAFNDYHTDPALKGFFNTDSETSPPDEFPSKSATPDPTSTNPLSNASNPLSAP
jgi:tetratricopeptide (TPR) repeat protein